jgi:hypothetical protein
LESALKIGTCSLKLRGSVFSALSSAYWALNSLDKVNESRAYYTISKVINSSLPQNVRGDIQQESANLSFSIRVHLGIV